MIDVAQARTSAPITETQKWNNIDWHKAKVSVRQLQMRIAKAYRVKQYGKVKSLQWLLAHSYYAKCLAVKRVTQNRGARTPGVDRIIWKTPKQKMDAVNSLNRHGYKTLPLRRIYIPKKAKGKLRPLSIPAMQCRAMQALYLLTLEPIAETIADGSSYGFRPRRSAHDAISKCHAMLARHCHAKYILEADIESCFNNISHSWLLKNVYMDTKLLGKWLKAGYIEQGKQYATEMGTPQGGTISATLLVIVLSGLEKFVKQTIRNPDKHKVNFSIYADDFVVTGATPELLEKRIKPLISEFLKPRGLSLSHDKTKITHINDGFDFLGTTVRKFSNGKLINKPSKASVKNFLANLRQTIKSKPSITTEQLIRILNAKIRGWTNYHRYTCAKRTLQYVSHHIFLAIWQWARRRHPNKNCGWVKEKYFFSTDTRQWIFATKIKDKDGEQKLFKLYDASGVKIRRHIRIKADANPFNPAFKQYFAKRAVLTSIAA